MSDKFSPQLLAYGGDDTPAQVGLNLSGLIGDAVVVYGEVSAGKGISLVAQALALPEAQTNQQRASVGLTYTTAFNLSLTAEAEYSSAAPSAAQWDALPGNAQQQVLATAQALQDLPTRRQWFFYATWKDVFVRRLDVSGFLRHDIETQQPRRLARGPLCVGARRAGAAVAGLQRADRVGVLQRAATANAAARASRLPLKMQTRSRSLASALLLQAFFVALQAAAGPVVQEDAGLSAKSLELRTDPAADDSLGLGPPLPADTPASDASRPGAARAGSQQPASAADAQAARSQRPGDARPATTPAARAKPAPRAASAGAEPEVEIDPDLEEAAKAALQWAHEARDAVLPAQQDGLEAESAAASAPHHAGVEPRAVTPLIAEPDTDVAVTLSQAAAAGQSTRGQLNLIQEAIALAKTIVGHPFTWLVVLLVAFGSAAVGVMRYRVYSERRRRRSRVGLQGRESLDPSRRRRHMKPTGTEVLPHRARSSDKAAAGRPGMRRASKPRRSA